MDDELQYWVSFSVFPGIGPVRFSLLLNYFGSAKKAWKSSIADLINIGLGQKLSHDFDIFRNKFNTKHYLSTLKDEQIIPITRYHSHYPKLLKEISDPPIVLFVKGKKGNHTINLIKTIGVVGTRKITRYGEEVTKILTEGLVANGYTVISGLAYGVDAIAHSSALGAGGDTIAVLGCGVDIIAPPSNKLLYEQIINSGHGAIISEMPPGHKPSKGLFPARNRIISGLSLGIIVTEGANDSGSLITARYAADQGREVFAVPGPITSPYSQAGAMLIKDGAHLVQSADDVVSILGGIPQKINKLKANYNPQTLSEQRIISYLEKQCSDCHINEIIKATNLTSSEIGATLSILELKGVVKHLGDGMYILI